MSRWLKINERITEVLDALTLAVLGALLLCGKIKGAPQSLLVIECGIATIVASLLMILADLGFIAKRWSTYAWWLLGSTLIAFGIASL